MNERYDWYEWYDRMNVAMTVSEMVVVPSMLRLGETARATATLISMGDGVCCTGGALEGWRRRARLPSGVVAVGSVVLSVRFVLGVRL